MCARTDLYILIQADFLKMYAIYCSNHENATKLYEKLLASNPQFADWINTVKLTNPAVKGAGLESYLIKPVQRLCRYPLLLKELLKVQYLYLSRLSLSISLSRL